MSQAQAVSLNQKYEKLKNLLKELFQLDQPDLDFGLYRIMHAKSAEITQFLDNDLLPQVKQAFSLYKNADSAELKNALAKAVEQALALGADPDSLPKVKELRDKLANEAVDIGALENEVYDHLFSFFRRYYSEGDFLAKRVYKPGVYAIPYEGEEVKLHWANRDQYYIKTSEALRDYAFRLRPDDEKTPMRVHFRLVDAAEGEHGNVKAVEGKERVFVLASENFIAIEDGDLVIRFEYRQATVNDWREDATESKQKAPAQKDLAAIAVKRIMAVTDGALIPWLAELAKAHVNANGETAGYSKLEAHLRRYVARNTFDYFIHKDLGGFLRRELDFYIKNEVMHLDDISTENASRVEQYLSKIKVIRLVGAKIIDFLAQLEDFQKKLWLKKKFVVETRYYISLRQIPPEFYPEIIANDLQSKEWTELFAINEIKGNFVTPGYTQPLTPEFLKANSTLVVDTSLFDVNFTERLLNTVGDTGVLIDGLIVNSDNFQALMLMQARHSSQVKCVYIDPPYNTGNDGFLFKDTYRHSSWISMLEPMLNINRKLMTDSGVIFASIDANERSNLEFTMSNVFGLDNRVEEIIWVQNTTKNQSPTYSTNHEYVEVFAKDLETAKQEPRMFREPKLGYTVLRELLERLNPSYPPIAKIEAQILELFRANQRLLSRPDEKAEDSDTEDAGDWKGLYNYTNAEYRDADGKFVPEQEAQGRSAQIWVWRESDPSMPQVKADSQKPEFRDPNHLAFRFYRPAHPLTGKPCPHPKTGWRWPYLPLGKQSLSFSELEADHRIAWGTDEAKIPQTKRFLHEVETNVAKSVVNDFTDGEKELANLFGKSRMFSNPKPTTLVTRFVQQTTWSSETVMDFFAGSGTTGHAVINLNRSDFGRRKFILLESGEHFETVLLPRIKKIIFAPAWKNGKPKRPITSDESEHSPRIVKVVRLESYEDCLNNLEILRSASQQTLLETSEARGTDRLKEQYLLRYMLEADTNGSQSLLNVQAFADPTAYQLKVKPTGSDDSRKVNVDLLETFNWLIGLTVQHIAVPQSFTADFERDSEKRLRLKNKLRQDPGGPWWFRKVEGVTPDGRKTLIVWRKLTGDPEKDNLVLDVWMKDRLKISTKDFEFDLIYVNGGNNLENLRLPDDTWKVRLIEEDFHRLMFDTESL
jgi:adenine-specific DNA-methyltransferase